MMDYDSWFLGSFKRNLSKKLNKHTIHEIIDNNFIRYYKKDMNNIIIYFSKGKIEVPYSYSLEKEILEKMKSQIEYWDKKINKRIHTQKGYLFGATLYTFHGGLKFSKLYNQGRLINALYQGLPWIIVALIWVSPIPCLLLKKEDIKKHILFLENEEAINKNIQDKMLELRIVEETAINLVPLFDSYANINDIHFMNKKEIQNLINKNIDKEAIYKLKK